MKAISTDLLAYLAEPSVRSFAVACVVAFVMAVIPAKRAVVRLYIWTGVLYIALAMPLLGMFLPHVKVAVPANVWPIERDMTTPAVAAAAQPAVAAKAASSTVAFAQNNVPAVPGAGHVNLQHHPRPANMSQTEPRSYSTNAGPAAVTLRGRLNWRVIFIAVYFLGFAILLTRLLLGIRGSHRLTRTAEDICARYFPRKDEVEDAHCCAALDLLSSHSRVAGLKITPRLKESMALVVPATAGIRRPAILLPAGWRAWSEETLRAVLAHEISHVARRDALTQLLSLLHRAIFWFSPLAWWLDRQLTELAEQASDEAALAGGADRTFYAETLLGFFAQLESFPARVRWHALSMANRNSSGHAERRVDRILAWRGSTSMKKSLIFVCIAFAAPLVFVAASLHPFVSEARAQAKPEPSLQSLPPTVPSAASASVVQANTPTAPPSREEPARRQLAAPRYVFIKADSNKVTMSGDDEDLQHARRLRNKIKGDFIWFERDEKSYVITDPAFLARVTALWAPQEELARQQDELGQKQDELGRQQDALGTQLEKIAVKVPDVRPELERIRIRLKELQAGATQRELGSIQSQIGELQSRIGHLQSGAGQQQSVIGRQQAELGRKQGELGRQQGDLGRRQAALARQASRELRGMFDDAIAKGTARPE